jgi:nitrate/nitrite transporter NarK
VHFAFARLSRPLGRKGVALRLALAREISAVAACGAFVVPQEFGEQIKAATPEYALFGFAIFYAVCLALNWWYYLGPRAEYDNP